MQSVQMVGSGINIVRNMNFSIPDGYCSNENLNDSFFFGAVLNIVAPVI